MHKNDINLGGSESRNKGLKEAKGEYILFVDADDYISHDWIENLIKSGVEEDYRYSNR